MDKDDNKTQMDEETIAKPATQGGIITLMRGKKTPAANGIATKL